MIFLSAKKCIRLFYEITVTSGMWVGFPAYETKQNETKQNFAKFFFAKYAPCILKILSYLRIFRKNCVFKFFFAKQIENFRETIFPFDGNLMCEYVGWLV